MASSCGCFEWWDMSDVQTLRKRAALEHAPNSGQRKPKIVEIQNEHVMNETCSTHAMRTAYKILVGKLKKESLERPRKNGRIILKIYLKNMM
jgi:hypothetical protein